MAFRISAGGLGLTLAVVGLLQGAPEARAQTTWSVDPQTSLAWWQINPHLGHLWATTCPADQSWQPGESRGSDYVRDAYRRKEVSIVNDDDPRVPVYPRDTVYAVCAEAVSGAVSATDTVRFTGVKGLISIRTAQFVNGMDMRDEFARRAIYSSEEFPETRFYIDSLKDVRRGDTTHAYALGNFEFRGVRTEMVVPIEIWRETAGLRVKGKFFMPASHLTSVYKVSKFALGLGIATDIWKTLNLGFDIILKPAGPGRSS